MKIENGINGGDRRQARENERELEKKRESKMKENIVTLRVCTAIQYWQ